MRSWFTGSDPNAGKDRRQKKKGMADNEMVRQHHWLSGHEFEQTQEIVEDGGAWCATVHGAAKSWTRLSNWITINKKIDDKKTNNTMKRQDRKRQVWKYQKPLNIYKILHLMKCRFKLSLRYYFSQKKKIWQHTAGKAKEWECSLAPSLWRTNWP